MSAVFSLSETLQLIALVALFFTTLHAAFLVYHWQAYGISARTNMLTICIYLAGCIGALAVMAAIIFTI